MGSLHNQLHVQFSVLFNNKIFVCPTELMMLLLLLLANTEHTKLLYLLHIIPLKMNWYGNRNTIEQEKKCTMFLGIHNNSRSNIANIKKISTKKRVMALHCINIELLGSFFFHSSPSFLFFSFIHHFLPPHLQLFMLCCSSRQQEMRWKYMHNRQKNYTFQSKNVIRNMDW